MTKKAKRQIKERSGADQLLPGAGQLRRSIEEVRFVVDHAGAPQPKVAVRLQGQWHLLDGSRLAQGQGDELAALALQCQIRVDTDAADRRRLCGQLLAAQKNVLILLEPDTYQMVRCGEDVHRVFVWHGQPRWVDDPAPHAWLVRDRAQPVEAGTAGTVDDWRAFAGCFAGNHYLVVGLGAALSALLLKPLGMDNLSLFYVGRTSIGKSAIQAAIMSMVRSPVLDSAAGTVRGLQQMLSGFSGQPVFLEDVRQQRDTDGLIELLFDVGNRASRSVGHASQTAVKGKALECVVIASNERTLGELRGGGGYDAGVEARVIELDIDAPHGAFHQLPEGMDGAQFAEHLKEGAREFHGAAWDAWVDYAAENLDELSELWKDRKDKLRRSLHGDGELEGTIRRALTGMAFWKFCLLMAAKNDIVPLAKDEINEAFRQVVQTHLQRRRRDVNRQGEALIARLRSLVEESPTRFPPLSVQTLAKDRVLGFRKKLKADDTEVEVYAFRKRLLLEALGEGEKELEHALESAGLLLRQKDGGNRVIKLPDGTSQRMLTVRATLLNDE